MERLYKAYCDYCWREFYEDPRSCPDYCDGLLPVMYTEDEDTGDELQATYYLDELKLKYFRNGVEIYEESYASIDEVTEELEHCSFDDYYHDIRRY